MASRVVMPKLSDTMEEGKHPPVAQAGRRHGRDRPDAGRSGDRQGHRRDGGLHQRHHPQARGRDRRHDRKIGALIAIIGAPDEDISALLPGGRRRRHLPGRAPGARAGARAQAGRSAAAGRPAPWSARRRRGARRGPQRCAPRRSRCGWLPKPESTCDALQGTGPQGRIIKRDIEAALAKRQRVAASGRPPRGAAASLVGRDVPEPGSSCRRCAARSRSAWSRARRRCPTST